MNINIGRFLSANETEAVTVTRYVPIIKSKKAELSALAHTSQRVSERLHPVIEVVADSHSLSVAEALSRTIPANLTVNLDCRYLGGQRGGSLSEITRYLDDFHIPNVPVLSLRDTDLWPIAREISSDGRGVCLRIGSADNDPSVSELEASLIEFLEAVDTDLPQVDLIIDYWHLASDRDVDRVLQSAVEVVHHAQTGHWRSVTLASGAFPESISHLPKDSVTALPRLDALLWKKAVELLPSDYVPDFGDYTIAHPQPPKGDLRAPLPNLRYAAEDEWHVYRQASPKELTNYRFHEICAMLVKADHWPRQGENYSWGDSQLARCARREGGPGAATEWRAWATSHHLALVTDRLATHGVP